MMLRRGTAYAIGALLLGLLIPAMLVAPKASVAMPTFAQAYGVSCSTCHTQVPLLNAYGRYVARTGYASLDRTVIARALPVWLGENVSSDTSQGAGSGNARTTTGNFALHATGYLAPDVTFHAQQWITQNNQSGGVDTLWVTYNNLLHRDGHLFVGKILSAAPSPYGQDFQLDGAGASSTQVGEHSWASTYGNRWGTRLAYVKNAIDLEAGYYLTSEDLKGLTDFGPGDKTFQWKAAYARPTLPIEVGLFGSVGTTPVSTGTDRYSSLAGFIQVDPSRYGRPGLFLVYQRGHDGNPGADANGNQLASSISRGGSAEIYEPILHRMATLGFRHDMNNDGMGALSSGNAINLSFNVPRFTYLHGYLEANTGANSALSGASSGPTFKSMLWLTIPIERLK